MLTLKPKLKLRRGIDLYTTLFHHKVAQKNKIKTNTKHNVSGIEQMDKMNIIEFTQSTYTDIMNNRDRL